jgi:hypothetical protein
MPTHHKNQHEWDIIAQCHKPYREFGYCALCGKYREGDLKIGARAFKTLYKYLKYTNPMYSPDSDRLFEVY